MMKPGPFRHRGSVRLACRGGAVLLECVLALTVFVGAGLAILAMMDRAGESVRSVRDAQTAGDIAASAMAEIEAGILSPEAVRGEVSKLMNAQGRFGGGGAAWRGWRIEVDTEPTLYGGLTRVTIKVMRGERDDIAPACELSQLVALRGPGADGVGEKDPIEAVLGNGGAS